MNPLPEPHRAKTAILRTRARELAREPIANQAASVTMDVIEFGLAHEQYAIEASYVREVHPLEDLTPLPCTPPFVRGLVNVRGRIFPVYDLKKFFDLPETGITDLHHILLVQTAEMELGILADTITGVRRIAVGTIQPTLPTLTGIRAEYLKGVTAERLVILAMDRILSDPRIIIHDEVEN